MEYMKSISENNIPWELIISGLQGELSPASEAELQSWLASDKGNQEIVDRLEKLWKEELNEYPAYESADVNKAWNSISAQLVHKKEDSGQGTIITGNFARKTVNRWWMAAAAILIVATGVTIWLASTRSDEFINYRTAGNEEKKIELPDGSYVIMKPGTGLAISKDFNKTNRKVELQNGEAYFEVIHQPENPFIVTVGYCTVKDIGTGFLIRKATDSIFVSVTTGEVAFIRTENAEAHELSAGMSLSFYTKEGKFGNILSNSTTMKDSGEYLYFNNTPLSEVIMRMEQAYSKKIECSDSVIIQKRLTAHLEGQSFEKAMEIICRSLNLEYRDQGGIYQLSQKHNE